MINVILTDKVASMHVLEADFSVQKKSLGFQGPRISANPDSFRVSISPTKAGKRGKNQQNPFLQQSKKYPHQFE